MGELLETFSIGFIVMFSISALLFFFSQHEDLLKLDVLAAKNQYT